MAVEAKEGSPQSLFVEEGQFRVAPTCPLVNRIMPQVQNDFPCGVAPHNSFFPLTSVGL